MALTKVTGELVDIGDLDISNVGSIQLDSIAGDADSNTSITFSGSDVITVATGGSTAATFNADQTTTFSGAVTANAGVVVDNITIDGTEIDLSSGDLTIDVADDIILDADGGDIIFKDGGTTIAHLKNDSSDLQIISIVQDKDIILRGNDGGSYVNALTLDMSEAGKATFNAGVVSANNSDTQSIFGRTALGFVTGLSDYAYVGHLDVADSGGYALVQSSAGATFLNAEDGQDLSFSIHGTRKMVLDDSGNLGIGTTSPGHPLHIVESADGTKLRLTRGGTCEWDFSIGSTSTLTGVGSGALELLPQNAGTPNEFAIGTAGSTAPLFHLTNSQNYFAKKIGIGTTSPSQLLHVSSTGSAGILLEADSDNANEDHVGEIQITQDGGATYHKLGTNNDNHAYINVSEALIIERQGTEKIRMDNAGKLFIGDSTFGGTAARFAVEVPASGAGCLIRVDSAANANETLLQFQDAAGQALGSITGNPSSNTAAYGTSSDYRLKENVSYTWDATTRLKQLKPARFNWKSQDASTVHDGFLAHEVTAIVPSAIVGAKDAKDSDDNPIYQQIDHSKLVPLLVKTIQELEARIATLEG